MLLHTRSRHCTRWPRAVTSSLGKPTWEGSWGGARSRLKEEKITTDFSQHGRQRVRGRDCNTHRHTYTWRQRGRQVQQTCRQIEKERLGCCLPSSSCFVISRIVLHERCDQLEKSQERFNCEIYLMKTSVYPHVSLAGHDLRTGLRLQLSKTEYQTTHALTKVQRHIWPN